MDSCKHSSSITSDYTFYASDISYNPFTVIYKNMYGWNFSLTDSSSYVLERVKIGWTLTSEHLTTRTFLPNFVNDYPEFFL